jgi:hypothetical protein
MKNGAQDWKNQLTGNNTRTTIFKERDYLPSGLRKVHREHGVRVGVKFIISKIGSKC